MQDKIKTFNKYFGDIIDHNTINHVDCVLKNKLKELQVYGQIHSRRKSCNLVPGEVKFKARFLCFMSGTKNNGNVVCDIAEKGIYLPIMSEVSFVLPESLVQEIIHPRIFLTIIETLSTHDPNQVNTYKFYIDGKKICCIRTSNVEYSCEKSEVHSPKRRDKFETN